MSTSLGTRHQLVGGVEFAREETDSSLHPGGGSQVIIGNPSLDPEDSYNADAGIKTGFNCFTGDVNVHYNQVHRRRVAHVFLWTGAGPGPDLASGKPSGQILPIPFAKRRPGLYTGIGPQRDDFNKVFFLTRRRADLKAGQARPRSAPRNRFQRLLWPP